MTLAEIAHWIGNSAFWFVVVENSRAAEAAKSTSLKSYYLVKVTGVGDYMSTDTLKVERTKLTSGETGEMIKLQRNRREASLLNRDVDEDDMPRLFSRIKESRFSKVLESEWRNSPWQNPEWALFPDNLNCSTWHSPKNTHTIAFSGVGLTDTKWGVRVEMDDVVLVDISSDFSNVPAAWVPGLVDVGSTSRLLSCPHWTDEDHAELLMQSDWMEEALLGDVSRTKYWIVTLSRGGANGDLKGEKRQITKGVAEEWLRHKQ